MRYEERINRVIEDVNHFTAGLIKEGDRRAPGHVMLEGKDRHMRLMCERASETPHEKPVAKRPAGQSAATRGTVVGE